MRFIVGIAAALGIACPLCPATAAAAPQVSVPVTALDAIRACPAGASTDPPVLLIPGTTASVEKSHGPVRDALARDGRCVYGLEYDSIRPLATSVSDFAAAAVRIQAVNNGRRIEVIGTSQGGLIARAVSLELAGRPVNPVRTVIAISGPQHGVGKVAGLTVPEPIAKALPPHIPFMPPALRDMLAGSPYLSRLNSGPITAPNVRYVMTATEYDRIVTPYRNAFVDAPGVTNIRVQDGCPQDHTGHIAGPRDPRTIDLVLNALDPVRHPTVRCVANNDEK